MYKYKSNHTYLSMVKRGSFHEKNFDYELHKGDCYHLPIDKNNQIYLTHGDSPSVAMILAKTRGYDKNGIYPCHYCCKTIALHSEFSGAPKSMKQLKQDIFKKLK
ncbi:MAG: hypothetical protein ACR2NY_05095 [Alphaproteobacteria bacterium]